jgi:hypothetical protein
MVMIHSKLLNYQRIFMLWQPATNLSMAPQDTQLRQHQLCSLSPTMAGGSRLPNSLQAAVEAEAPGCLVAGQEHPQNDDFGGEMNPTKFATFAMFFFCCLGTISEAPIIDVNGYTL